MGSASNMGAVMTLANSIIGVSVLAMPFCFKQCGILLSIMMLILSSMVSRLACHFLLKAAHMARRRNFEFLAFQTFGPMGKFLVELCIIGFLMGTCIAFFVVMGDLGPVIIAKTLNIGDSTALRPSVVIGVGLFVVVPLGLLRNVDSLSSICTASVVFYICFVLKVVVESLPHLLEGDWMDNVYYWKPSGVLQCIPIFSMALFCQTQLFEIYESIPNASLEQMNELIRKAVNICTCVYISVGFFGYIAFCTQNFSGNVLLSFSPSLVSDVITLGFVMSIAVSFPLTIFPCRASIYSLLFRRVQMSHHDGMTSHIPEARFKCITLFVVSFALVVGLLVPSIEVVLGLVGSTIGVLICIVFPAVAFIRINTKSSYDRLLAQIVLFVGALILVLGTYATLNASSEAVTHQIHQEPRPNIVQPEMPHIVDVNLEMNKNKPPDTEVEVKKEPAPAVLGVVPSVAQELAKAVENVPVAEVENKNVRQEPPVPVEPAAVPVPAQVTKAPANKEEPTPLPEVKVGAEQVIHQDAIKKEEEALAEAGAGAGREDAGPNKQQVELLLKLEEHKEEQKKLLQEQQDILQQLNKHKQDLERSRLELLHNKTVVPSVAAAVPSVSTGAVPSGQPPVVQDVPAQPRIKDVPAQPKIQDMSAQPRVEDVPAHPKIEDVPAQPRIENVPAKPRVEDVPAQSRIEDVPAQSRIEDVPAQSRIEDVPAKPRLHDNKSSVLKPQSIIPIPLAVQNNSKLLNKALQQVAQSHLAKENLSFVVEQGDSKRVKPKETHPINEGKEESKAKEKVVQRDILSNMGPSHEREKRDVEEQSVVYDKVGKNTSEHAEHYCDIGQKKTIAEKIASDTLVAPHELVSPKIENLNFPIESKFHGKKDNQSMQQVSVMENVTVTIGDSKDGHHSHNMTVKTKNVKMVDKTKSDESASASIIKMVPYLSVQSFDDNIGGVIKDNKADGWKQSGSLAKPMSRDLKSFTSQQFMRDIKIDSQKLSDILNESIVADSVAGQQLTNDDVPTHSEELVNAASQNLNPVMVQKYVSNVSVVAPNKLEALATMAQQQSELNVNVELLKRSKVVVKPMSRDLKSVAVKGTSDVNVGSKLSETLLNPLSQHLKSSTGQRLVDTVKRSE